MKKKEKKLFAFDIDGTLLNDDKKILPSTKKAIIKLINNNHVVVLSTGRSYIQTIDVIRELNLKHYVVANNGCCIYDIENNDLEYTCLPIQKNVKKYLYKLIKSLRREMSFSNGVKFWRVYFGNNINEDIDDYKFFIGGSSKNPIYDDWKVAKKSFFKENNIVQISLKFETKILEENFEKVKNDLSPYVDVFETSRVYLETQSKNVNKSTAISLLAKKLNIDYKNIYCFGDSNNDYEMIKNCYNGIAMGNSKEELKKVAKYVIGNNNQNAIEIFLKKEKLI